MRFAKQLPIGRTDLRFELETTRNSKIKKKIQFKELYVGIRLIGVLALLMLAAAVWLQVKRDFVPRMIADVTNSPHQLRNPVLAMELIETPAQLSTILGTENPVHNRQAIRDDIRRDYYFIISYVLLYVALSFLLARRRNSWAVYLAWVAAVCGVAAAVFDVRENMGMMSLVNATTPDQLTVNGVHIASTIKWALSFVTSAILATTFFGSDRLVSLIGVALTLTAVLGLVGIFNMKYLPYALYPLPLGLVLLVVLALVQPRRFVELY